jgi:hypothetical protein
MALCTHNKLYNQKVLFIAFFTFAATHYCLGLCLCMLILTWCTQVPVASHSRVQLASLLTTKYVALFKCAGIPGLCKVSLWYSMVTLPPVTGLQLLSYHQRHKK